jgi:Tfp pilus assembly protein PilN
MCRQDLVAESKQRRVLEQEIHQLYGTQQRLEEEVQRYAVAAEFFKNNISKYFQGLNNVVPMLEELRSGLSVGIPT